VYIFGKPYRIPEGLTILQAMETAGHATIHECGCRGGFCGACTVAIRKNGGSSFEYVLACRTVAENGMSVELPRKNRTVRRKFDSRKTDMSDNPILRIYPEIRNCIECGACSDACPNGIDVMKFIIHIRNGEIEKCAELSLGCIMCGACSIPCPIDIDHAQAALMARRINGKYLMPQCEHLDGRIKEIQDGKYMSEMEALAKLSEDELKDIYGRREMEK